MIPEELADDARHALGVLQRELLGDEADPRDVVPFLTLKHALDPKGILNRGKIFDLHSNNEEAA